MNQPDLDFLIGTSIAVLFFAVLYILYLCVYYEVHRIPYRIIKSIGSVIRKAWNGD